MRSMAKREWVFWSAILLGCTMLLVGEMRLVSHRASRSMSIPSPARNYIATIPAPSAPERPAVPAVQETSRDQELVTSLLVEAVVQIESSGRPRMVGRHGERGLMQIKSGTWADMTKDLFGKRVSFERAFEPQLNRQVGKAYLAFLHDFLMRHRRQWQADERSLLLACYNAGPTRVREAGFNLARLPRQARDYVSRASALHETYLANHDLELGTQLAALVSRRATDS